ncbi:MAG: hypothetical protein ACK4ZJ_16785, partial [Allorhizobium sp.]
EPSLNVAIEEQALGRVHRIGQRRSVLALRLIAEDTVEERVLWMQQRKRAVAMGRSAGQAQAQEEKLQAEEVAALFGVDLHALEEAEAAGALV